MKKQPYSADLKLKVKAAQTGNFTFNVQHADDSTHFSQQFSEGDEIVYPANQMRPGSIHTVSVLDPKFMPVMFGDKKEFQFETEPAPAEPETKQ